jgi:hypothetical protein
MADDASSADRPQLVASNFNTVEVVCPDCTVLIRINDIAGYILALHRVGDCPETADIR